MTDQRSGHPRSEERRSEGAEFYGLGLLLGVVIGTAIGNFGMGLSLGLLGGSFASAWRSYRRGANGARAALAINFVALVVVTAIIWYSAAS